MRAAFRTCRRAIASAFGRFELVFFWLPLVVIVLISHALTGLLFPCGCP